MASDNQGHSILVCGFGIIGLTTSIRLLEAGYKVTVVASHHPGDALSAYYASSAAGAHHLSFAADDDKRQQALDRKTFDVMWKEEEDEKDSSGLMRLTQHEFYATEGERHIAFFESLPDFIVYPPEQLPPFAKHAVSFTSLTMDTSAYLQKLVARFEALGGTVHRAFLDSLVSAIDFVPENETLIAIVNCTGLGSLKLKDVEDTDMYPIRGQVVVLKAPWIKEGRTNQMGKLGGGEGGERTYIIPRRSGEVIIGGTREVDDWMTEPRPETSLDIKRRALSLFPELAPESSRALGRIPVPEDLDPIVLREVVGFRPARKTGLRLERGKDIILGSDPANQRRILILHNIGHSGAGWQSCWGCAEEIVKMVNEL
ncbi:FAD dependent oxidoreductase [Lyophyllum atratum]|nr:FAD dependent oxidoreductase [Lyophyllum atratum]